jgi:hypothetical protein
MSFWCVFCRYPISTLEDIIYLVYNDIFQPPLVKPRRADSLCVWNEEAFQMLQRSPVAFAIQASFTNAECGGLVNMYMYNARMILMTALHGGPEALVDLVIMYLWDLVVGLARGPAEPF